MPRPILAEIIQSNLRHNLLHIQQLMPNSKILAAVKANAYGHGLLRVFPSLAEHVAGFGILTIEEGITLRNQGWMGKIVLLEGCFDLDDMRAAEHYDIAFSIHQSQQIQWLKQCPNGQFHVFLKMNTGMNRLGFLPSEFHQAYQTIQQLPQVKTLTLMTHFANSDASSYGTTVLSAHRQAQIFQHTIQHYAHESSLSNSAAILQQLVPSDTWIRPGVMVYGGSPFGWKSAQSCGLKPAMRLTSKIIAIQHLKIGDTIGYGSRYTAHRPMRIGIVACGYGDGYPRHAPDGTPVIVGTQRTQLIGRVSMDMLTIDITHHPRAQIGTSVELWGEQLAIDEVAQQAGTISYELMCALAPRVPVNIVN